MPRTETILKVFIASPSDLKVEREALESVIQELNIVWSRTLGVRLELVKWETHTYPAVGTDAQGVINEQAADDYDIFIGIMWARFGTPTERAGSGTAEEFYRAYKKHQERPNQVRIMFYFKDAPISPSELDPTQLASIKEFQQELGEKGTYYWTYTSSDEFAQLVRMHLGLQVQEWGKNWGIESEQTAQSELHEQVVVDEEENLLHEEFIEDEEGFLDLLEIGQENFETGTEALARMTTALQDLTERVNIGANELNSITVPGQQTDLKQAKRISNRVAEALANYAALMEVDVPILASTFSNGIEAYSHAFALTKDLNSQDKASANQTLGQLRELEAVIETTRGQMSSFRNSIADIPRATTMFNRARRRALSILDKLDEELATVANLTAELAKVIEAEVQKENGIDVLSQSADDPILQLGTDPVEDEIEDASENHDRYLAEGATAGNYLDEDWTRLSQASLARAYGEDEVEYSLDLIKEPNPDYEGR